LKLENNVIRDDEEFVILMNLTKLKKLHEVLLFKKTYVDRLLELVGD
jgi:hypothetical protein